MGIDQESRRKSAQQELDPERRSDLGQVFTPLPVAAEMGSLIQGHKGAVRVLDPGAGIGLLADQAINVLLTNDAVKSVHVVCVELDQSLTAQLAETMAEWDDHSQVSYEIVSGEFVEWATGALGRTLGTTPVEPFDLVITNPPYGKLSKASPLNKALLMSGGSVPNLYAGFVRLSLDLLGPGGQLVAITPRSFTNGTYFAPFRREILASASFESFRLYDKRNLAFGDAGVLQETIIFSMIKDRLSSSVLVQASLGPGTTPRHMELAADEVVSDTDPARTIYLPTTPQERETLNRVASQPQTLDDLGIRVSTGPVVDFRATDHLHNDTPEGTCPLLYPAHLRSGVLNWPITNFKKYNSIDVTEATQKLLVDTQHLVLVKRFTSKEERRRIVAFHLRPEHITTTAVGIENHLNYFIGKAGQLDEELAAGITAYLNSHDVDEYFRTFSGHTQVNAGDLRLLRYPTADDLRTLGQTTTQVASA